MTDTTQASEASMPCLPTDDEAAAHDLKRKQQIEKAITVVSGPGGWYVVEVPGRRKTGEGGSFGEPGDPVDIIYGPLESVEAAEFARKDVVLCMVDEGSRYGPSEVPDAVWNVRGRILRFLRNHAEKSPEGLAVALEEATPWGEDLPVGILDRIAMWHGNDGEEIEFPF